MSYSAPLKLAALLLVAVLLAVVFVVMPAAAQTPAPTHAQNAAEPVPSVAVPNEAVILPSTGGELRDLILACQPRLEQATAETYPGLYRDCYGFQSGIAIGWLFYVQLMRSQSPDELREHIKPPFCLEAVKDAEVNQAILDFVESDPRIAKLSATATLLGAFIRAFPCKNEAAAQ